MAAMRGRISNLGVDRFSGLYLWILIIVVFSLWIPDLFLNLTTARSVASAQAIVAILALAATISLASGAFDISIGAVANLSTVTAVSLQTIYGWGMWSSILVALAIGVAVGITNGFIIVVLKVNAFVATLGTGSILLATQEIVSKSSQPPPPSDPAWSDLTLTPVFGFQIMVVYMLILMLVAWWVLAHTPVGRYVYAAGSNPDAARLSGINVGKWQWLALIATSSLASFAGVLYASAYGPSLTYGPSLLLPAFAAAFLGSTQFKPGRYNVWGTVIAVLVLATGVQGLQLVTGVAWLNEMFSGTALILAVGLAGWRQRGSAKARRLSAGTQRGGGGAPSAEVARDASAEAAVAVRST